MPALAIDQAMALAMEHHKAGHLPQAESIYRQVLASVPQHSDALHLLGLIAYQTGHRDAAVVLIQKAIAQKRDVPLYHSNLGEAHRSAGQLEQAIAAYRAAIQIDPNLPEAHYNLGALLAQTGMVNEALAAYRIAIKLKPDYAEAHNNLGNALQSQGHWEQAIEAYHVAIQIKPDFFEAHNNLGVALKEARRLDEAVAAQRRAIQINPDFAPAYSNLGTALKDQGQLDESISAYRHALKLKPDLALVHSNLICTLYFHPGYDAHAIQKEQSHWNEQHAEPLRRFIQPHLNGRDPERRLKIGYFSPNFRDHCQSLFTVPLFGAHDRDRFEIYCYADVATPDRITQKLQGFANTWRSVVGLSDQQVVQQIREDHIDILIDLTMHMADSRLRVFAHKPAPVQVTWLAYPASTGLTTIDYRLSDPHLDPPGIDESVYSEKTIRLPDSFWCYDPLDGRDLAVNALPATKNGFITFGCLNNFCKINPTVLKLWAQVLSQIPRSRLLLLADSGTHREQTQAIFAQHGIDPDRIEFVSYRPRPHYLALYHKIDLGLDSFPYNGHTTSLDSFWMGVPIVTLVGQTPVARAGWCQLANLELTSLAAHTPEQFVKIAVELATDLPRLAHLRSTLRSRMQASPIMDAPRFARNIEAAYRQMWHTYCEQS